ncbi:diaminopropionate ammonia-lyase [Lacrimispora sp.]|uniref:diaminopropionate ammonia-lyase n=1 Tax=Lacrimispora sp. TaxID=2719234 RepID=UPI002FD94B0C
MDECVKIISYDRTDKKEDVLTSFTPENAKKAMAFHKSFPEYTVTPLMNLKSLAKTLGVKSIHVKDESYRFGLNAFKILGGSYCIGTYIAEALGVDISELSYDKIISEEVKARVGDITFVTATDGNHGRGIAWTANRIGQKSVVYMPSGSAQERLDNIKALGADASITDLNYDDAVRLAEVRANENGWVMVQDTAWEGYNKIPNWIMQGYMTMALEAVEQLKGEKPTHIFLQAGVGAMAGAIAGYFTNLYHAEERPVIVIVEPNKADCIYRTAEKGEVQAVKGDMNTIMAGLACGEPCTIGWDVLKNSADHFISMPDYIAAKGMRILGNPLGEDRKVISGESGAATVGFVAEVMQNESMDFLRKRIGLNEDSRVLCFSTEGDTDRENYRRIVWDGFYPSF